MHVKNKLSFIPKQFSPPTTNYVNDFIYNGLEILPTKLSNAKALQDISMERSFAYNKIFELTSWKSLPLH